jgi:hypothetical protein
VRNFTKGNVSSPSTKLLLAVITSAAVSLGGCSIASHKSRAPSGSGIYKYRGYVFPNMPSNFEPTKPIAGVLFPHATLFYTTTGSLSTIESEIKNICEGDDYFYPTGEWGGISISNHGNQTYAAQANICSTKNDASRWQFNVSLKTMPDTYDVAISSEGPPVPT